MAAIYSNGGNRWNILGFNFGTDNIKLGTTCCESDGLINLVTR
jgi:hypothetical protein